MIKALLSALSVVLFMTGAALIADYWQQRTQTFVVQGGGSVGTDPAEAEYIRYDGIHYKRKEQLRAYLFMGVDNTGPAVSSQGYNEGGQADVQLVLVIDEAARSWHLLQLNRDSIVDIPVLGINGTVIGTERRQLALAHAYGDGLEQSCGNAVTTVSNLLGGQSIDGYLALNIDAISILNDLVGGVTVTIQSDFSKIDPTLVMGQTITLHGQQAVNFIRERKSIDDETNLTRMSRQKQYLDGLKEQYCSSELVIRGYDAVYPYMVTDLGSKTVVNLYQTLEEYAEQEALTIAGRNYTDENGHTAYALDEDDLQRIIVQLFYEKA